MRRGATLIFGFIILCLTGCHQHKPTAATQPALAMQPAVAIERYYEPSHCSALAFSPPVAQNDAPLNLARADREVTAFVGFEDLIRSYIYVRTDDRFSGDGFDHYERRAISEKIGSSTR